MTSIALALLMTCSPVQVEQLTLRAFGTVTEVVFTPIAPFEGAAVGDEVEFVTTVVKDGMPADFLGTIYTNPAFPGSWLRVGTAVTEEDPDPLNLSAAYVYNNYPGLGDKFLTGLAHPDPFVSLVLDLEDPTGTIFSTPVLDELRGVYTEADFGNPQFELREGCIDCASLVIRLDRLEVGLPDPSVGDSYCGPAVPNSSGVSAEMLAEGSAVVVGDDLTLRARDLPPLAFGFFVVSRDPGFASQPGGSQGNLCLSGEIGRFIGSIQNSGLDGQIAHPVSLGSIPQPSGSVSALPGETWHFQAWYRDANPGVTSNFTDAVAVTLF